MSQRTPHHWAFPSSIGSSSTKREGCEDANKNEWRTSEIKVFNSDSWVLSDGAKVEMVKLMVRNLNNCGVRPVGA